MTTTLLYGDLDLNDGVAYKIMLDGFSSPEPSLKQLYSDSPLVHGQLPTEAWKYNNRKIDFSIKVLGATDADLETNIRALEAAVMTSDATVTYQKDGGSALIYLLSYRPETMDSSTYFQRVYQDALICVMTWQCQGYPFGHLDRVTLPLVHGLGLNDSFVKRDGDDFENWVEAASGGTITANTSDYLEGGVSCKMTTTDGADTCKIGDEDYLTVNELHAHNEKLYVYKNSGTVTLSEDLKCYNDNSPIITRLTQPYAIDKLLMDGTTATKDLASGAAFTKTGGVGNTWPGDSSNFRTILGAHAPVIAQAAANQFDDESASFEGNTVGSWAVMSNCALAASTAQAWHGTHSMKMTTAGAGSSLAYISVTGIASTTYTASCRFKGNVGSNYNLYASDTGGATVDGTAVIGDGTWQTCTVTITWSAGITTKYVFLKDNTGGTNAVTYWDAFQIETGTQTPFALGPRTVSSMTIPTATIGLTAGQDLSIMCVVNTPWAGNDGTYHWIFDNVGAGTNDITIYKDVSSYLYLYVTDATGATKYCSGVVNPTNWAANTNHVIIVTLTAANVQTLTLDGVALTPAAGAGVREAALGTNTAFGTNSLGNYPLNGSILSAIWGRVLTAGEIASLSNLASWANLTDITVSGLATGNAVRVYSGVTLKDSGVETGGIATLTPEGPARSIKAYEDDTYASEIVALTANIYGGDTYNLSGYNFLDTLSLLSTYNPAATTWMDVLKVAGSPVVYPSDSSLSPRFPEGTAKVKREIRHDTTVGVVSLDSLYFGDTEYVVGHETEGSMAICVPPGDCPGDVPARARLHVGSAYCSGPWSPQSSGTEYNLNGIFALDATHTWAVGDYGKLLFYNGLVWAAQSSSTANNLQAVSAYNSTRVWGVGDGGAFTYWNGSTWAAQTFPAFAAITDGGLEAWTGNSLNNWDFAQFGYTSMQKAEQYHSGSFSAYWEGFSGWSWASIAPKTYSIAHPGDVFTVTYWIDGRHGGPDYPWFNPKLDCYNSSHTLIAILDGTWKDNDTYSWQMGTTTFAAVPAGTSYVKVRIWATAYNTTCGGVGLDEITLTRNNTLDLYGICAITATNIVAVGEGGCIVKSADGTTWTEKVSGAAYNLKGVDAVDASHIWAVGDYGTILFSADGTTWTAQTSGVTTNLVAVYALDSTHVWATGAYGVILFFNGTTWAVQTSGTVRTLCGVYAYDSTHVWAVGDYGTILFFNGTTWTVQGSGTPLNLLQVSGVSDTSVWAVGQLGTIIHGIVAVGTMPLTNLIVGQRDTYAENWNSVQDATGSTATLSYSRHGQYYRAMAAGATNKFRFPVGSHRGRYIISLGATWGASTTYDQVTIDCYLEAADGTRLTATTISLTPLDMGNPNTKFKEVAFQSSRLIDVSLPTHYVPQGTNEDNIYQVFEVKASGSLATTQDIDCMTLMPVDKCVEISGLANNFVILDSEGRANLISQDGSLDTATMYDPTKTIETPQFEADPTGMNLVVLAGNTVSSDDRLTPKLDIVISFEPQYWMIPQ